jgi:hypothetical protein
MIPNILEGRTTHTCMNHIDEHLGMAEDQAELAPLEEYLLACSECAARAEEAAEYVDTIRAAIYEGDSDLD